MGFEHTDTSSHAQYKVFEMHYMYATTTLEEHLDTNAQQAFRGEVREDGTHPHFNPHALLLLTDIDPPYRTFPFSPALGKGHFSYKQRSAPLLSLMTTSRRHQLFKIEAWSSVGLECRQCCSKSRCFLYPWCGQVKERRNICELY